MKYNDQIEFSFEGVRHYVEFSADYYKDEITGSWECEIHELLVNDVPLTKALEDAAMRAIAAYMEDVINEGE